jgi:hypothetical protein
MRTPEPDGRVMALADCPYAHDETNAAWAGSRLIWVQHHARIAEGSALNGVLAGEGRSKQQTAGRRQLQFWVQTIGEFIGVPQERLGQPVMPTIEACAHVVVAALDFLVREGEESAQDSGRARLVLVKPFVSRHEQAGHNA